MPAQTTAVHVAGHSVHSMYEEKQRQNGEHLKGVAVMFSS